MAGPAVVAGGGGGGGDGCLRAAEERLGSNLGSKRGSYLAILARGGPTGEGARCGGGGGGCGCIGGDIMAEVKMGEGSPKGGKGAPTEESGSGEVRHSGDGDTWRGGDTGDPVKGVAELGGVVERGEEASKAAAAAAAAGLVGNCGPDPRGGGDGANGGGEAGLGGPLPGAGGLILFSFWRLLQNHTLTTSFSMLRLSAT